MASDISAERFWDRMAKNYDREERGDEQSLLKLVEKSKSYLNATDSVLDFGCGTGSYSIKLASEVEKINAIDISSKMLEVANLKASTSEVNNIAFSRTSIFDNKFPDNSFDAILAFYILHLVDDPTITLKRILNLVKPGGLIISATPCMGEKQFLKMLFSFGGKLGVIPKIKLFKQNDLVQLFENSSFEIIRNEPVNKKSNQFFIVARKKS